MAYRFQLIWTGWRALAARRMWRIAACASATFLVLEVRNETCFRMRTLLAGLAESEKAPTRTVEKVVPERNPFFSCL